MRVITRHPSFLTRKTSPQRYAPEKIDYGIKRYQTETKRLYQVLETRLQAQDAAGAGLWMVGGRYTIADLACFSWVNWAEWAGVDTAPYAGVTRWMAAIQARPATQKGVVIPDGKFEMKEKLKTKEGEREYAEMHSVSFFCLFIFLFVFCCLGPRDIYRMKRMLTGENDEKRTGSCAARAKTRRSTSELCVGHAMRWTREGMKRSFACTV